MRDTFIKKLIKRASTDLRIVLIVGDLGYNVVEEFANKFPLRFINAGICEQNMTTLAAGMASEGFKVFVYSISNFPTFRSAEQIRNDICYHNLDVTTVIVGGGVAYGNLGYSHHAIQDYGLMRLFPEMTIISPGDPSETNDCMNYCFENEGPKYLRLRKAGEINFSYDTVKLDGSWNLKTQNSSKKIFLTTGYGLKIAHDLKKNNESFFDYEIYSCPIWGMKYQIMQDEFCNPFNEIITVEDHLKSGGFGSWLSESIIKKDNKFKIRHGFLSNDIIGKVGSEDYLLSNFIIE
jgi:transketolase